MGVGVGCGGGPGTCGWLKSAAIPAARRCIHSCMHSDRFLKSNDFLRIALGLMLAALLLLPANGCKSASSSGSGDNGSSSSSGSGSGSNSGGSGSVKSGGQGGQQGKPGGSGGGGEQLSEPVDSTTGQATADSDDGSPRAVSHTSTSMPGAPQSTLKGTQQDKKLDSPESQNAPKANTSTPNQ